MRRGGVRQRLGRAVETDLPPEQPESKLANVLLRRWAWGSLSLPQLQDTAAAAERDFQNAGARPPLGLSQLAALGTRGTNPNNLCPEPELSDLDLMILS